MTLVAFLALGLNFGVDDVPGPLIEPGLDPAHARVIERFADHNNAFPVVYIDADRQAFMNRRWLLDGGARSLPSTGRPNEFRLTEEQNLPGSPTRGGLAEPATRKIDLSPDSDEGLAAPPKVVEPWQPPLARGFGPCVRWTVSPFSAVSLSFGFQPARPSFGSEVPPGSTSADAPYLAASLWSTGDSTSVGDFGWVYLSGTKAWFPFAQMGDTFMLIDAPTPTSLAKRFDVMIGSPFEVMIGGERQTVLPLTLTATRSGRPPGFITFYVTPPTEGPWDGAHIAATGLTGVGQTVAGPSGTVWKDVRLSTSLAVGRSGPLGEASLGRLLHLQQWPSKEDPNPAYPVPVVTLRPLRNPLGWLVDLSLLPPKAN